MDEKKKEIRTYFDLAAWQHARTLVKRVYELSRRFPKDETYGLMQQIRRAAVSVPSNIAEGYGRGSRKDYLHFLRTARGSLYEVQTQVMLAEDLGFVESEQTVSLMEDISVCSKLLYGLIRSLDDSRTDESSA